MLFRRILDRPLPKYAVVTKRLWCTASWSAAVVFIWMSMAADSWAQGFAEEEEPRTYVPSYMIIVFAVAFALMMICRSGKRTTSFRVEE